MDFIIRYPKTKHILGSKECDINLVPQKLSSKDLNSLEDIKKEGNVIIEEKMDGIGIGIFFKDDIPYVQVRGQVLDPINHPLDYDNVFNWIEENKDLIKSIVKEDFVMYGEWMEFKHSVFYNALPSYFIEYDIYDIQREVFLDTPTRHNILTQANFNQKNPIVSAHVIHQNNLKTYHELVTLLKLKTAFGKDENISKDFEQTIQYQKNKAYLEKQSLVDVYPEGFYIKVEKNGVVLDRYKFIRKAFLDMVISSNHWKNNQPVKNKLKF